MTFIKERIKRKLPTLTSDEIDQIFEVLSELGVINNKVEYRYQIFKFYKDLSEHYNRMNLSKKCGILDTMQHFKISQAHLYRIISEFS
jgi:hypothetical protein